MESDEYDDESESDQGKNIKKVSINLILCGKI